MTDDTSWPRLAHLDDYSRYGRQMILDKFGLQGQIKLQRASVAVIGAGGLGCPALQYLAAAGPQPGRIAIIDHDTVELSNIQRQVLHNEETIGMSKVHSAAAAIKK
ncbi:molybdopterin biosynthesis protein MoeB [Chiua virens]|nr:molybdopterin biosynthesis protein MoeB [Chiua virens]